MNRFFFASLGLLAGAAVLFSANEAHANGRFPESNQLIFSKTDHDLVLLRVTFGLLVSHDRGKTFDWVCEQSIGYSGVEDPMYATTPNGRFIATTFQGITGTDDQACSWKFAQGDGLTQVFVDLTQNPNDPANIVAFSSGYLRADDAGNTLFKSQLWETKDEGRSFTKLGPELDPQLLGYTLDVTKSDPNRIYLTAVRGNAALLLTSRDHGTTWTEQQLPLVGTERSIWIAAIDPDDADKVFLRTSNNPDAPGRLILREKDPTDPEKGTFKTLFTSKAPLDGFAISPDRSKIYVGSPLDGVYMAHTSDYQFTQQTTTAVKCLAAADDGLWACSNEGQLPVGFIAGISQDDGKTFSPVAHFCSIRGPLSCAQGSTTASLCVPVWPLQRDTLGCTDVPDAGTEDGGVDLVTTTRTKCDCQTVLPSDGWSAIGGFAASIGAAALAVARRRRRRR